MKNTMYTIWFFRQKIYRKTPKKSPSREWTSYDLNICARINICVYRWWKVKSGFIPPYKIKRHRVNNHETLDSWSHQHDLPKKDYVDSQQLRLLIIWCLWFNFFFLWLFFWILSKSSYAQSRKIKKNKLDCGQNFCVLFRNTKKSVMCSWMNWKYAKRYPLWN